MRQVTFQPTYPEWQSAARYLLEEEIAPENVLWVEADHGQGTLELFQNSPLPIGNVPSRFRVPPAFVLQAQNAARHSSERKWSLLYRVLWRLTHGEPKLLSIPTDLDVIALTHWDKEVQKDAYRMRAFLRFRETILDGSPWFVAWYEPEHHTLDLNAEFFTSRFTNMRWSILTPKLCMHWNGEQVSYSPGVTKSAAPSSDSLESLWITYYSNIFNPARIKPAAMQAQLLKRNWKNLPEAVVIDPLLRQAPRRTLSMLEKSESLRVRDSEYGVAEPPSSSNMEELRTAALGCRACPLWKTASCTVFGDGPAQARIMLVGEAPGDQEDRTGKPFVGPAGQLLDRALGAAGLQRKDLYITNAVKHFPFDVRGRRRAARAPSAKEIAACRPWLENEVKLIRPVLIVALGSVATRSIFSSAIRVTEARGQVRESPHGRTLITLHPSALLRLPDKSTFESEFERYVRELQMAHSALF